MRAARIAAVLAGLLAGPAPAQDGGVSALGKEVIGARYEAPTTRYDHGVLGDDVEWGRLAVRVNHCPGCAGLRIAQETFTLPRSLVFEDTEPRLAELPDGSGRVVIVVESHRDKGARLAIYDADGRRAATPFIGRRHRWLAPVGGADLDGDGVLEIAYIDRPHLAKRLRVWRYEAGALTHVADLDGLTNHRIGWPDIPGGIRDCGTGPEMVLASADWSRVVAVRFDGSGFDTRDLGPYRTAESLAAAMAC